MEFRTGMNIEDGSIPSSSPANTSDTEVITEIPKRPLNAYNYFFQHERKQMLGNDFVEREERSETKPRLHRRTHGKCSFSEMAKRIAQKWKKLDEDTRLHFEELAEEDRKRYRQQKNKTPTSIKRAPIRPVNAESTIKKPKRPMNGYNYFFQHERRQLLGTDFVETEDRGSDTKPRLHRKTHGKCSFGDMAKGIAQKWKTLDEATRLPFEKLAEEDRERYREQLKVWKKASKEEQRRCKKLEKLQKKQARKEAVTSDTNNKNENQISSDIINDPMVNQGGIGQPQQSPGPERSAKLNVSLDDEDTGKWMEIMSRKRPLTQQTIDERLYVSESTEALNCNETTAPHNLPHAEREDSGEEKEEVVESTEAKLRKRLNPERNSTSAASMSDSALNNDFNSAASTSSSDTNTSLLSLDNCAGAVLHALAGRQSNETCANATGSSPTFVRRILEEKILKAKMKEILRRQVLELERAATLIERSIRIPAQDPWTRSRHDQVSIFTEMFKNDA